MLLHPQIKDELKQLQQQMIADGDLPAREKLNGYYRTFRERFGPERLRNLDGEELLYTMHGHRSTYRDSLVYWLEFKNDDEFPGIFGSIAGGSSYKFGVYQRKEDGIWMTGSAQSPQELTVAEAIDRARRHREQIQEGVALLNQLPMGADDPAYAQLQEALDAAAPDVAHSAWGHKYFSLLFPDRLDDYHVAEYQRFHLIKLLQLPPEGEGRFRCAGRYVAIANELDMPLNHLTTLLNRRDGRPHSYWRIGSKPNSVDSGWEQMRDGNYVAIGWSELGDLSASRHDRASREAIRELLEPVYPDDKRTQSRKAQEIFNFVVNIQEGDWVLPSDGSKVLAIGRVKGDYYFVADPNMPHRRPVEWLSFQTWTQPKHEGLRTTVYSLRKHPANLVEAERQRLISAHTDAAPVVVKPLLDFDGIRGRIHTILTRKKQVILYGPPGTGKTYWARTAAQDFAAAKRFGRLFAQLNEAEKQIISGKGASHGALVRMCTFHPAYGYEDFLEGYRPHTANEQLVFQRQDGIFKALCDEAVRHPDLDFYLIIDEINRGDIPRIFGELLTILEKDKRQHGILLPLSSALFTIPDNVYILGTMNTADRSIALLDTALRRRFGFVELMPDSQVLHGAVLANSIPLGLWLDALNERILAHIGRDARNLQIGHAYLLENGRPITELARFIRVLQDDIVPLLEEYCYEDYMALSQILGESLVDKARQRIRHELFSLDRQDALIEALLAPSPDLLASAKASREMALAEKEQAEEEAEIEDEEPLS